MNQNQEKYKDPSWKDWVLGIGYIILFLIVIGVGAVLLVPDHFFWWLILVIGATLMLAFNQNRNYACRCRSCEHEFEIGFLTNLISPHGIDKEGSWLWVRCPGCQDKGKVTVIRLVRER